MLNLFSLYKSTKNVIFLLVMLIILLCSGCVFYEEDDQFAALKTEAVYSAYGFPGFVTDSVSVIETDDYGRILYKFHGINNAGNYGNGADFLLVCQYIDYEAKYVYYYPETQIIMLDSKNFSEEEASLLKEKNDWNKDVDLSK